MNYRQSISSILILGAIIFVTNVGAKDVLHIVSHRLMLGDTSVNVNLYEKPGSKITFFAPHHNEQAALKLAKEYVEKYGGRLIEVQSFNDKGVPNRFVNFSFNSKNYIVDPNRIFTENGRSCRYASADVDLVVKLFADNILKMLLKDDQRSLRDGESVLVAVHNNSDVDAKNIAMKAADLTALSFYKGDNSGRFSFGSLSDQAAGLFLSNLEADADNFVFLSSYTHLRYFTEKGFNVIIQKPASQLQSKKCTVDDGSLSVYSGQQGVPYICIEADGSDGGYRQRQMMEAIYQLIKQNSDSVPKAAAGNF